MDKVLSLTLCYMGIYRRVNLLILIMCFPFITYAQDKGVFKVQEDSLKSISDSIVLGHSQEERDNSCYRFIKTLVRTLKNDNSFSYSFDSLWRIKIINAPDNTFRIFSWQVVYDDGSTKYFGAIQKNNKELDLYPLFDKMAMIQKPQDTITDNNAWYGAIYYKIIQKKNKYFLLGWRNKNYESNVKLLDVLSWNDGGKPVFGDRVIETGVKKNKHYVTRLLLEYKTDATVIFSEDPETGQLIYDHLISEHGPLDEDKRYFIPDGSYDALKYKGNKWRLEDDFYKGIINKEVPNPAPLDFKKIDIRKHAVPKH